MIVDPQRNLSHYRWVVSLSGLIAIAAITWHTPPSVGGWTIAGITVIFAILLGSFRFDALVKDGTLIQVLTIGTAVLYSPTFSAWTTTLGLIVAWLIFQAIAQRRNSGREAGLDKIRNLGFSTGLLLVPLGLSALATSRLTIPESSLALSEPFVLALLFGLIHGSLLLVDALLREAVASAGILRNLFGLILYELLPLPFILLAVITFPENQIGALIAIGGIPAILAVLLQEASNARRILERRVRELSSLNQVSRTLRSSLDLKALLAKVQEQVAESLGVDNFYVALLDPDSQKIWFPLAVSGGEPEDWPRRDIIDNWTDRVILMQAPRLITRASGEEGDVPEFLETASTWIGVPLIAAEKSLGCLAVYSTSEGTPLSRSDLELLVTLSGQVSVAIENALLFQEAQEKADQLENLNRIASLLTRTLDIEEVLTQVCRSAAEISKGRASAIYLIEQDDSLVQMAKSIGLSEAFCQANQIISTNHDKRTTCLRIGQPALNSDIKTLPPLKGDFVSFSEEGIGAFGDFPLSTPEGLIGFLSVYFSETRRFREEQVEFLETFASQAALAISNARRFGLTDMALSRRAHQLSILESIGRELSAATHSGRLFELILDHALEFTNSPWGSLYLLGPESHQVEVKATRGYQDIVAGHISPDGIMARLVRTRQPVNLGDTRQEQEHEDHTGGAARSQLSVPLTHEERVLGVLVLESPTVNAFTPNDQTFISQLAVQAAIALVNASLYHEIHQRLEDQARLYQVSKALVGNLEIDSVLRVIVQAVDTALHGTATGIYLWDPGLENYQLKGQAGTASELDQHLPACYSRFDLERSEAARLGTGLLRLSGDSAGADPSLAGCSDCQTLMMPLVIGADQIGTILAHLPEELSLDDAPLQLGRAIASQGAIAIQNALLFTDVAESKDRLEVVLNSVEEGVLMVDARERIMLANAAVARIAGVPLEDLLEKRLDTLPRTVQESFGFENLETQTLIENLSQIPPPKVVMEISQDNQEMVLERFSAPVWGQGREIIGWVFVLRDVSEEHQLNQTRKLIADTLVHDLRSPVGAVSSALIMLEDSLPAEAGDDITMQSLDIAKRSTKRVLSLIESLLDISRMESGHIQLDLSTFDLRSMTQDLIAELKPQAKTYGIVLSNEISAETPPVSADRDKIARVIVNLLDNALKFTPEGGRISISVHPLTPQTLAVQVSDSGPGIPDDYREKIFERFSQVPGYPGRRRGSGIGLTFCRLALEAHGERIWVDSPTEGGSVFNFSLPISVDDLPA